MRTIAIAAIAAATLATPPATEDANRAPFIAANQRAAYRNPDGSCVQCSISMAAAAQVVPAAEALLRQSPYGPPIRGGSNPSRVEAYCRSRGIKAWSITGPDSMSWIDWALRTNRPAAVTWGPAHMITVLARDADGTHYQICDNNATDKTPWVDATTFRRNHQIFAGGWCVILDAPPAAGIPTQPPTH